MAQGHVGLVAIILMANPTGKERKRDSRTIAKSFHAVESAPTRLSRESGNPQFQPPLLRGQALGVLPSSRPSARIEQLCNRPVRDSTAAAKSPSPDGRRDDWRVLSCRGADLGFFPMEDTGNVDSVPIASIPFVHACKRGQLSNVLPPNPPLPRRASGRPTQRGRRYARPARPALPGLGLRQD